MKRSITLLKHLQFILFEENINLNMQNQPNEEVKGSNQLADKSNSALKLIDSGNVKFSEMFSEQNLNPGFFINHKNPVPTKQDSNKLSKN